MSEITRRNWLARGGTSYLAGALDLDAAQHVHNAVAEAKEAGTPYAPKYFEPREYKSLAILADLIMPADERSKGALDAGAPEFIDLMCSQNEQLAVILAAGWPGWPRAASSMPPTSSGWNCSNSSRIARTSRRS